MTNLNEAAEAYEFLEAKLSGDATLLGYLGSGASSLYPDLAPPGVATPYVLFSMQSEVDSLTATAVRILARPLFQVKAVGPANQRAAIRNAANRIDTLLARTSGTTTNAIIEACWRDGAINIPEVVDGALWTSLGGLYRLEIAS
jgi:hypothetical protein